MGICHATSLKNKQRGSAIIFAMGLSLLVVALSVALLLWLTLDIRRVQQLQTASDRLASLETIEAMAAEKINSLPDDWNESWQIERDEQIILGQLHDLSGRININTLFIQEHPKELKATFFPKTVLTRLFESKDVPHSEEFLESLTVSGKTLFGIGQNPDLQSVKDYLYATEPSRQQVNVNSTSPEVLASILDINLALAESILAQRPFESVKHIIDVLATHELTFETVTPIETWLRVDGNVYLLETTFEGKRTVHIYSIFYKENKTITLLWRSWGIMP